MHAARVFSTDAGGPSHQFGEDSAPGLHRREVAPDAGFRPGDPNPDLLTEDEAVRYLRLDLMDIKNPRETLRRYRKAGHLQGTQVSKRVFYLRKNLNRFLDTMTERNPR
jgi:hypothetical protein